MATPWARAAQVAETLAITERHYLAPMARLHLDIKDAAGQAASARVSVTDAAGRFYAPANARISADDSFDRSERHAEAHYFHLRGEAWIDVPPGAAHVVQQAQAENLSIVNSLIVNKEQRYPDIAYNGRQLDPASTAGTLVVHGQEYHTSYWGHLGLLDISVGVILPGYVGYPNVAASSLLEEQSGQDDHPKLR